ncbi:hypothetical protein ACEPPN_019077 [Leptodophora sp. 'Broadleaf-Isolate-01']
MIDSSDLLVGDGIQCTSYDEEVTDGEFKTHNLTPDEVQRTVITDRDSDSYFPISVRMTSRHRIRSLPGASEDRLYDRRHQENHNSRRKRRVSNGTPATASLDASTTTEESYLQQYFQKGSANMHFNDRTRLDDYVWWALEENRSHNFGINPVFLTAVLSERDNIEDFVGKFNIRIRGSFRYHIGQIGESVGRFIRRVELDDPVNFSPTEKPQQGKVDSLKPKELGNLRTTTDDDGLTLPADYLLDPFLPQ